MKHLACAAICAAGILTIAANPALANAITYKLVRTIDLPGGKGGHGDWTIFNPETGMVWLSQSPDHAVVVIDAETNTVSHVIYDVTNSNGIGFAGNYAFAADNASNAVVVINQKTFAKTAILTPEGKAPDTVNFLSREGRIYVSGTNQATEFGATEPFKVEVNVRLSPDPVKTGPDIAVYVVSADRIYQPVDNVLDVIDAKTGKLTSVWKLGIEGSAKAAAYDAKTNRLIVGTGEKKILVLDAESGKVEATIAVPGSVDATVVDESARRAYVADESGVVDVIDLDTAKLVDSIPSEKGMHTLAVDAKTHRVYVYRDFSNKLDVFEMVSSS